MAKITGRPPTDSPSRTKPAGEAASMAALFLTIMFVSLGLALWTDMNIVLRGCIAVLTGIAAAAITLIVVKRYATWKGRGSNPSGDAPAERHTR